MPRYCNVGLGVCFALLLTAFVARSADSSASSKPAGTAGVQITKLDDRLRVEVNGKLFTEYFFKDTPRPYCYPIIGPGGVSMTRDYPMKTREGEDHDHPHHRSLWFAHGDINGMDFWSEQKAFGKTLHVDFREVKSGKDVGVICSSNQWVSADGKVVCTDERTLRFYAPKKPNQQLIDFDITLFASNGELTLGDTKEGTMAIRLAETMKVKTPRGSGHIVNSAGVRDGDAWGKRAEWCDYYGPVDGKTVGVAIFDNPKNPRFPTWWHVRDYGLFAANPFGQHDFEKMADKKAGNLVVPAGKSVTFRYRFYIHAGDTQQADVAAQYRQYAK